MPNPFSFLFFVFMAMSLATFSSGVNPDLLFFDSKEEFTDLDTVLFVLTAPGCNGIGATSADFVVAPFCFPSLVTSISLEPLPIFDDKKCSVSVSSTFK